MAIRPFDWFPKWLARNDKGGAGVSLPDGFEKQHSKENNLSDSPSDFCSKSTYIELFEKVNQASLELFGSLSDSDLDLPGPPAFQSMFPTVGAVCVLIATHPMMHAGQVVPVRRQFGKPVLM